LNEGSGRAIAILTAGEQSQIIPKMANSENHTPQDDMERLKIAIGKLINFLKETLPKAKSCLGRIYKEHQGITAWLQALVAVVMTATLVQNCKVIHQNTETLKIEQETRLNPELECSYNWASSGFIFRNIGDAAAQVMFLETSVYCVQSNEVLKLTPIRSSSGSITPPLNKFILNPGETANALDIYVPDMNWVTAFWKKYGGDLLIRVYVEFDRASPMYRRYSGYYNFSLDQDALLFPSDTPKGMFRLLTEEENPYLLITLDKFNSIPANQFYMVVYYDNMKKYLLFGQRGINNIVSMTTNGTFVIGSWAKLH
jgi:hypothetical protein